MRQPPYMPFMQGPLTLAPGLRPVEASGWLTPDSEAPAWLEQKRQIMVERRDQVFASLASEALLEEAACHLPTFREASGRHWPTPLEAAAAAVSDDLCLLVRGEDGLWRLVAGSVVAPTFWILAEKLGAPLAGLHAPVPGACPVMVGRVHRIFDGLRPGTIIERFNWTVQTGPERFTPSQAGFLARASQLAAATALDNLWLRVERQTVSKTSRSGAIMFTIRVAVDPLRAVLACSAAMEAFEAAWRSTDPALAAYKGWPQYEHLVMSALEQAREGM